MTDPTPYPSAAGVEAAIKATATVAAKEDSSLTVAERIRLEYFHRFLSRVFADGENSEWLLKGGTAVTQRVDGTALARALEVEARRRKMHPLTRFEVPQSWGPAYAKMAKRVPHLTSYSTVAPAAEFVASFIEPALNGLSNSQSWDPQTRQWEPSRLI